MSTAPELPSNEIPFAKLEPYVGRAWLSYVSNSNENQVKDWIEGVDHTLNPNQTESLIAAMQLVYQCIASPASFNTDDPNQRPLHPDATGAEINIIQASCSEYVNQETLPNTLRIRAGGRPLRTEYDKGQIEKELTALEEVLLTIALDYYPTTLLPAPSGFASTIQLGSSGLLRHPLMVQACQQVLEDPYMSKLWPRLTREEFNREQRDIATYNKYTTLVLNDGSIANQSLIFFPGNLISQAHARSLAKLRSHSPLSFITELLQVVTECRELARRKVVNVPCLVFLNGIQAPKHTEGNQGTGSSGSVFEFEVPHRSIIPRQDQYPHSVHNITFPLKIATINTGHEDALADETMGQVSAAAHNDQDMVTTRLRLAYALSESIDTFPSGPTVHGKRILNPFQGESYIYYRTHPPMTIVKEVSPAAMQKIYDWLELIERSYSPRLDVAVNRLLAAATERIDARDAFIDAMIGLESLFSGTPDVSLRVTCCTSWCIHPRDFEQRILVEKRMKDLYAARSNVVHGNISKKTVDLTECRKDAVKYLIECLRYMFRERPALIDQKAADRSKYILLGSLYTN